MAQNFRLDSKARWWATMPEWASYTPLMQTINAGDKVTYEFRLGMDRGVTASCFWRSLLAAPTDLKATRRETGRST